MKVAFRAFRARPRPRPGGRAIRAQEGPAVLPRAPQGRVPVQRALRHRQLMRHLAAISSACSSMCSSCSASARCRDDGWSSASSNWSAIDWRTCRGSGRRPDGSWCAPSGVGSGRPDRGRATSVTGAVREGGAGVDQHAAGVGHDSALRCGEAAEQQGRQQEADDQVDHRGTGEHTDRSPARLAQRRDAELQPDRDEREDQEQRP